MQQARACFGQQLNKQAFGTFAGRSLPRKGLHLARRHNVCAKAQGEDASAEVGSLGLGVAAAGLVFNPIVLYSEYVLKTTGAGLPPGPGGLYGAAEGIGYLVVVGIVAWSLYTKVKTGSGLPAGPSGLLGAAEGFSYLSLLGAIVVFGLQFLEHGSIPGPLGP